MKTRVYYFSATGNSLQVARDLSAQLDDVQLRAVSASAKNDFLKDFDAVGFIFPVHAWGIPQVLVNFIKDLTIPENIYIFAVATCGGGPGGTLLELDKLLRHKGLSLSSGFYVKQPDNYIIWSGAIDLEKQREILSQGRERLREIAAVVRDKRESKPEKNSYLYNLLGGLIHKFFVKNSWRQAKNFWVKDECNACETCVRICPVENIKINDNKPTWGDKCQQCLACLQWCPCEAIQYKQKTLWRKRYRHPNIPLEDLFPVNEQEK